MAVDETQQIILDRCAQWADAHPCLKNIYVFGSIARGDYRIASDVDIAVEFQTNLTIDGELVRDFTQLHSEADEFCFNLKAEVGRDVHLHRMIQSLPEDHAWPAIVAASKNPVAAFGKAMLVATPPKIIAGPS